MAGRCSKGVSYGPGPPWASRPSIVPAASAMEVDELMSLIGSSLEPLGFHAEDGEEFRAPALDVLRYWQRPVRLSRFPVVGRGRSVVAIARQPDDVGDDPRSFIAAVHRLGSAADARFPPWPRGEGLMVGLTAVLLVDRPLSPEAEGALDQVLENGRPGRRRVVPLAIFCLNSQQEAMAQAFAISLTDVFPEPTALAEVLSTRFGRYVPSLPMDLG